MDTPLILTLSMDPSVSVLLGFDCKGHVTRDDSQRRFLAQQHCCDIVSNKYNIVPTLHRCVALKIVVMNRPV